MYLDDTYEGNLRYVYRHFTLSFHDKAVITAEATEAAGAQGQFWEMHDLLYERQQEWNALSEDEIRDRLIEYAEELGLDVERFTQELDDHVHLDKVNKDTESAIQAGLPGTPSYIVNGVLYPMQEQGFGLHPAPISGFIRLVTASSERDTGAPSQVLDEGKEYSATIRTGKGDIVVDLFADQAPVNANSFAFLAQEGWYDGLSFFYVDPDTAAYAGDPTGMGWSFPHPGYVCGDEVSADLTFDEEGVLALFTPSPGRNSSLFFITYTPLPDLNGRYTIIGRVVEGMDVAKDLAPARPASGQPADVIETILIAER